MKVDKKFFQKKNSDQRIPLNTEMHSFRFTRRWFLSRNITTWSTYLLPRFGGGQPIRMVQIGVFEGMDLVWCFQNLLKHSDSIAEAIDPWEATTKLSQEVMDSVKERAVHNLSPWKRKLTIFHDYSFRVLPKLRENHYDLVVIDGDHRAPGVLSDAEEALRILKPGGWMVFDDVRNRIPKKDHVQDGIRQFLEIHKDKVSLEWQHRFCDCYGKRR